MALNGDLRDLSLPDLFYIFQMRGMSGRLALQADHDDAVLYFQRGKLVYIASSHVSQHLGQLLVKMGKLSLEQLGVALAMQATAATQPPLGEILVNQGWLSPDDLDRCLTHQAEEVLYRVLAWPGGSFHFDASSTAPLLMPLRDLNAEQVILEATRRADERAAIRAKVPNLECRVILANEPRLTAVTDHLRLKSRIVIAAITEGAATLRQVARATGLDDDEVSRIAYELAIKGVLTIEPASEPAAPLPQTTGGLLAPRRPLANAARAVQPSVVSR
ncbi:MAG: DUF4388 domain-containing protein [Chloroflexi bacterium]|nr:DUF4388 domain-containing protein [Chloroflexota bacterium]